jgi:hypothetical protein
LNGCGTVGAVNFRVASSRVGLVWPWLGATTRWPAYGAAGIAGAYGILKLYWVLGGTALWDIAPLPQSMIEKARTHTADRWFVIADALTVVLAAFGIVFALATTRARSRWLPVWAARCLLWPLAALMVLRAVLAGIGDAYQLLTVGTSRTAWWDLFLWSPLFLVWGLLWAATALTYGRRVSGEGTPVRRIARQSNVEPAGGP